MAEMESFSFPDIEPDYHAVFSVQLCELVNDGFDVWGDKGWVDVVWPHDDNSESWLSQTETRVKTKFLRTYWYREITPRVPGIWRYNLTTRFMQILPKYIGMYEALADGITPLADSDTYSKNRRVLSDFPAAQINQQVNDYASSADDYESEEIVNGNIITKMEQLKQYNDVDTALIKELEPCFCQLFTATMGGM